MPFSFAKRVGKDRAKTTYNKYLTVRKYVAEFIKYQYKRSDMSILALCLRIFLLCHSPYYFKKFLPPVSSRIFIC